MLSSECATSGVHKELNVKGQTDISGSFICLWISLLYNNYLIFAKVVIMFKHYARFLMIFNSFGSFLLTILFCISTKISYCKIDDVKNPISIDFLF